MNRKIQSFFAAFAVTGILIGALCGFAAVDLSTDRYMPGQFGTFFEITRITAGSVEFSFLAEQYVLDTESAGEIRAIINKYRGLLPVWPQIFSSLAANGTSNLLKEIPPSA